MRYLKNSTAIKNLLDHKLRVKADRGNQNQDMAPTRPNYPNENLNTRIYFKSNKSTTKPDPNIGGSGDGTFNRPTTAISTRTSVHVKVSGREREGGRSAL